MVAKSDTRQNRLAEALRENLKRRKAKARTLASSAKPKEPERDIAGNSAAPRPDSGTKPD